MRGFVVENLEPLSLARGPRIAGMYALSPYVWKEGDAYSLMLRIVPDEPNPADKIARIHYGRSKDGLHFILDDEPVIAPGPDADDLDGCEDPTVIALPEGYFVYYTGWNETRKEGKLLLAKGPDPKRLAKIGVAIESAPDRRNPKEATVIATPQGDWRMFFEYAAGEASKIGVARAATVDGPWSLAQPLCAARPGRWDGWHISTGPVWQPQHGAPIMFYNGANQNAHWRIGWIMLDASYVQIVERAEEPLIIPPPPEGDATDIAFAASCISEGDLVQLYYSVADKDMLRATLRPIWN
ncbi:hypothetical protein CLG96_03400 [Sphingomonas oleivorans]|uniref:Glycosidase n=1 Tax=Sphingomonas oleivorans TaxID=1735121 RepID=A0A2T5G209_9SPHN|nr:hypothetical protein [Sphingomonas oleivorans]PTQ13184.1 hypothetical protein CLG96_03400 [Sphingomonas oleivorans]